MNEKHFVVLGFDWSREDAEKVAAEFRDEFFKRVREREECKEISDDELRELVDDSIFICKEEDIQ